MQENLLSNDRACAAPSLTELPPEKGTILEIQSISDEYNGRLVEFYNIHRVNGKYSVITYDSQHQPMTLKPKNLKRPDVKPLRWRKKLHNKAARLVKDVMERTDVSATTNFDREERHIRRILNVDPCNVLAHHCLAQIVERKVDVQDCNPKDKNYKNMLPHVRSALANAYAYRGLVSPKLLVWMKSRLLGLLKGSTKKGLRAQRLHAKIGTEYNLRESIQIAIDQFMVARGLIASPKNGWENQDASVRYREGVVAALKALRTLHDLEPDLTEDENAFVKGATGEIVQALVQVMTWFTAQCKALCDTDVLSGDNWNSEGTMIECSQDMVSYTEMVLLIAGDTLAVCTLENGSIPFLRDDLKRILEKRSLAAASALDVMDPLDD